MVLDLVPPMELHLMLGVVSKLYDGLDDRLKRNRSSFAANDWAAPLGLARSGHYGEHSMATMQDFIIQHFLTFWIFKHGI